MRGYNFPFALHLFLSFTSAISARKWLQTIRENVTTALPWSEDFKPNSTVNIAFTFEGLRTLGVSSQDLASFPGEFREGMAARAALLGDVSASSPDTWEFGQTNQPLHALLSLHAVTGSLLTQCLIENRSKYGSGIVELFSQETAVLPNDMEHFGFRDGLSQPPIEGSGIPMHPGHGVPLASGGWRGVKAGEFILGYKDEAGSVSSLPATLTRNGTFLVIRKLRQHVALFRSFLHETALRLYGPTVPASEERLAAKFMGRWRSGAPLELAPDADDPHLATNWDTNNDFRYGNDPKGLVCPRGAHIRRTNPRDALDGQDVAVHRHRMLRRGMPYGSWLPERSVDEEPGRGLVFIALNADIHRQFEFVQTAWINEGGFAGLGSNDRDPVVGANDVPGSGSFLVPGVTPPFLFNLPRFTTTRGGGYFFVPGIAALRSIADS